MSELVSRQIRLVSLVSQKLTVWPPPPPHLTLTLSQLSTFNYERRRRTTSTKNKNELCSRFRFVGWICVNYIFVPSSKPSLWVSMSSLGDYDGLWSKTTMTTTKIRLLCRLIYSRALHLTVRAMHLYLYRLLRGKVLRPSRPIIPSQCPLDQSLSNGFSELQKLSVY